MVWLQAILLDEIIIQDPAEKVNRFRRAFTICLQKHRISRFIHNLFKEKTQIAS